MKLSRFRREPKRPILWLIISLALFAVYVSVAVPIVCFVVPVAVDEIAEEFDEPECVYPGPISRVIARP